MATRAPSFVCSLILHIDKSHIDQPAFLHFHDKFVDDFKDLSSSCVVAVRQVLQQNPVNDIVRDVCLMQISMSSSVWR